MPAPPYPTAPIGPGLRYYTPSGQQVDPKDMEEHMKIELSNAKALEEKKKKEKEERESNLVASGKDILASLKGSAPSSLVLPFLPVGVISPPFLTPLPHPLASLGSVPISSPSLRRRRRRRRP